MQEKNDSYSCDPTDKAKYEQNQNSASRISHLNYVSTRKQVSMLQAGQLMTGLAKHAPSGPSSLTSGHCFNQIQEHSS
jgi:hypothetical protein